MCGRKKCCDWRRIEETKSIGLQHPAIDLAVTDMNWAVLILKKLYQISISLGCVTKRYSLQAFIDATYGKLVRCNAPCCSVAWRVTVYTAIICTSTRVRELPSLCWMDKFLGPSFQRQGAYVSLVNMVVWAMQWKGIDGLPTMNGAMARRRWTAIQQHDWYGCIMLYMCNTRYPWHSKLNSKNDPWLNRCLNRIENCPSWKPTACTCK